jgi:hypothetical protein
MRNNLERLGLESKSPQDDNSAVTSALNFVVPTEIVDLPSKGLYYPEGHPLHHKDTIEIRYMTAKDEDTLTNQSLLKKGLALEKVLQDIIIDKSIKIESLLIGDKNAIIVAARKSAYGSEYETKINCPSCTKTQNYTFDLNNCNVKEPISLEEIQDLGIEFTEEKTFLIRLPVSKFVVEIKLLNGKDENYLSQKTREAQQAKKDLDSILSTQLRMMIRSVNEVTDNKIVNEALGLLPAKDSITIRHIYKKVAPSMDLSHDFECRFCSHETRLEVPFTADFFWPK